MQGLRDLHRRIAAADRDTSDSDDKSEAALGALQKLQRAYCPVEDAHWEYEQVAVALGRAYGRRGKWRAAAQVYQELIEAVGKWRPEAIPQHALYAKYSRALRKSGDLEGALLQATSGVIQNPLSATIRRELGKAHFALLQFDEALAAWEHTLWLTPNDPVLHWKVGFCRWCIGQDRQERKSRLEVLDRAARNFEQAVLLSGPERLECWAWSKLWLGRVRLEQGEIDVAVEHLRAAKGTAATELTARLFLGEAHLSGGEVWLSRHRLDHVFVTANEEVQAGRGRDLVDDRWGRTLSMYEVASRARLGGAYWLAVVDGDLREGLRMAEEAEALARRVVKNVRGQALALARCLDLEARIRGEMGDLDQAIALSRRAAALHPASDILLHELRLYEAQAERASARLDRAALVLSAKEMVQFIHRVEADGEPSREADAVLERLERGLVPAPPSPTADSSLPERVKRFARRQRGQNGAPNPLTVPPPDEAGAVGT